MSKKDKMTYLETRLYPNKKDPKNPNQVVMFGNDIWWSKTYGKWYCRMTHVGNDLDLLFSTKSEADWKEHLLKCHNCIPPVMPGAPWWP